MTAAHERSCSCASCTARLAAAVELARVAEDFTRDMERASGPEEAAGAAALSLALAVRKLRRVEPRYRRGAAAVARRLLRALAKGDPS